MTEGNAKAYAEQYALGHKSRRITTCRPLGHMRQENERR